MDSDFGISDSINSNSDNTWFEKRDDIYEKAKKEENSDRAIEKDNAQEKVDPFAADEGENNKTAQIDENACEVINVDSAEEKQNIKEAAVQEKNEGEFVLSLKI